MKSRMVKNLNLISSVIPAWNEEPVLGPMLEAVHRHNRFRL
jgi:hypothetical protein